MEEEESYFLRYTGYSEKDKESGKYHFFLKDNIIYKAKKINYIADPCYDSTFKILFGSENGKKRLIDLLNSIIFPDEDEDDEIIELTYVNNEFTKFNKKNNRDTIRADITSKVKTYDGNEFLICLEIQIGQKYNFTKRLFNYGTSLRNSHKFKDCYSIGFFLSTNQLNRKSSIVNLIKNNNSKHEKILKYMRIIEIDINAEVSNILDDEPVIINHKYINEKGKEYIKLFGIRNWCNNNSNRFRIPKIDNVSSNDIFKECLSILSSVNQDQISKMSVDEQSFFDSIKSYKDEAFIIVAFDYFLKGKDKKEIFEHFEKYDVNFEELDEFDIKSMLPKEKENNINNFIKFLKKYNYLEYSDKSD